MIKVEVSSLVSQRGAITALISIDMQISQVTVEVVETADISGDVRDFPLVLTATVSRSLFLLLVFPV